jgi:CTP:molybdopterin cytidylyltransferase MocA
VRDAGDTVTLLSVDDEGVVLDVDTMEDYRKILGMTQGVSQ